MDVNTICLRPTLRKQARFFEKKPNFLELENGSSLNKNWKYLELKTWGSLSENLIWWNKKPGLFSKNNWMCKHKTTLRFLVLGFWGLTFRLSFAMCTRFSPSLQCATFLNSIKDEDMIIFCFPYCLYSSLYMALVGLQSDEDEEGDLFLYKEIS